MKVLSKLSKLKSREEYISEINNILGFDSGLTLSRPEHVLAVYYLGDNLLKKIFGYLLLETNQNCYFSFDNYWKYCAIFHDVGYSPEYQIEENRKVFNHAQMRNKYLGYVFDADKENNDRWLKSFSSEEIEAYYNYWYLCGNNYLTKRNIVDGYEIFEHGILGGYIFTNTFHNNKPHNFHESLELWNEIVLVVSLMIAQHNIWPIPEQFWDVFAPEDYADKNGKPYISREKFSGKSVNFSCFIDILSYSICLIDSIDIVKKLYGKRDINGVEQIRDFNLLSELEKVIDFDVKISGNQTIVAVNSNDIKVCLGAFRAFDVYENWINGIKGMQSFLDVDVEETNEKLYLKIRYARKKKYIESNKIKITSVLLEK